MKHAATRRAGAKTEQRERGAALLMALMLVAVAGIGAGAVWSYLHVALHQSKRSEHTAVTQCLAEAGLDKAVAELRAKRPYTGETNTCLDGGRFSVRVNAAGESGHYLLESLGEVANGSEVLARCALRAELTVSPEGGISRYQWRVEHGTQ